MANRTLMPSLRALALAAAISGYAAAADDGGDYAVLDQQQKTDEQSPRMYGVEMSPVPTNVQEREGLTPSDGVYVQSVFKSTAASLNGTKSGDVILTMNGTHISSMSDLRNEVGLCQVGDTVDVVVRRNGQDVTLASTPLGEWPKEIPRERIDPDAERRFRQWQQERLNQQRQQVDDIKQQLAELEKSSRPLPDAQALARAQELQSRLGDWHLSWSLAHRDRDPVVAVSDGTPATAAPEGERAVRLSWTNDHRPRGATP